MENDVFFLDLYPDFDLTLLPRWLQENISDAKIIGKNKRTVALPDGRKYSLNNTLNSLSSKEWVDFINSVFFTQYPTTGKEGYGYKIRRIHPTPKPPQLMRDIIYFFTKEGELVLDTFMGVGGTLLGASLSGRIAAGIELNDIYIKAYREASISLGFLPFPTICGDSFEVLNNREKMENLLGGREVSLLLIDPPYGNMMNREKTGEDGNKYGKEPTPFTSSEFDLGNMDKPNFLNKLKEIIESSLGFLKSNGHVVIFIKDLQPLKKETNLLHAEVISKINEIPSLFYKGLKIWADKNTKSYPYGYPFSFVANQIHQYILVFRKE